MRRFRAGPSGTGPKPPDCTGSADGEELLTDPVNLTELGGVPVARAAGPSRGSEEGYAGGTEQRLDVAHQRGAGPDAEPLVEPQDRLPAAVDELQLHLGGAGVTAEDLAQPLHDRRR